MNVLTQLREDDGFGSFRVLADTLPQLALYVDQNEICRAHNVAVENVLGLSAGEIHLRSLRDIAGSASYECIRTWVTRALAGEHVFLRQVHRAADGRVLSFDARYAPHFAPDGRVLGFCAVLTPGSNTVEARPEATPRSAAVDETNAETDAVRAASAFDPARREQALLRITSALQGDRFCLYQQPIIAVDTPAESMPRAFEVLLRLRDKDNRLVHPGSFLQEAEETGCMVELDRWVIDRLVNWYVTQWVPRGDARLMCHINLSMSTVSDSGFSADLRQVIQYHKLPAAMLCFEISEDDLARHRIEVMACMQALRILGCRVGLDRVTGVSGAFSALPDLPIHFVKIDGSIVAGMRTDSRSRAKVRIVAKLAQAAGIAAIAERVEDPATIDLLRAAGVGFVQGYGVSMPEPLA